MIVLGQSSKLNATAPAPSMMASTEISSNQQFYYYILKLFFSEIIP
jgi:hypothetical protein